MVTVKELELRVGDIVRKSGMRSRIEYYNTGSEKDPCYIPVGIICRSIPFLGPRLEVVDVYEERVRIHVLDSLEVTTLEVYNIDGSVEEEHGVFYWNVGEEIDLNLEYSGLTLVQRANQ